MANEENLISLGDRTTDEQREIAKKGGIASGEARREKKLWKDEIMKRLGENDWNKIIDNLIDRAKKNDKSFEVLRDTMGQKPVENTEQNEIRLPILNIEVKHTDDLEKEFNKYDTNG